jgi:hypothetical protein
MSTAAAGPPPAKAAAPTELHKQKQDGYLLSESFYAGAIAGLIAETVMHPFDTVSHRAKVRQRKDSPLRISG